MTARCLYVRDAWGKLTIGCSDLDGLVDYFLLGMVGFVEPLRGHVHRYVILVFILFHVLDRCSCARTSVCANTGSSRFHFQSPSQSFTPSFIGSSFLLCFPVPALAHVTTSARCTFPGTFQVSHHTQPY